MKKFCINVNGNDNNFSASRMFSFVQSKILSVTDPRQENEYLNAFATNMDFSSGCQTYATVT